METLALGLIFLGTGNFIDRPSAAPAFIITVDDPPFSIALMIIGLYVMFSCLRDLKKPVKEIIVFLLLFVWTFYLIIFAIHDIDAPTVMPGFTTIFISFIDIRILFEAFWSEP